MALVPQDNVRLMLRHLNVGVCVCWVPKLSLQSWRCNQWSQRERLSDQPLHVCLLQGEVAFSGLCWRDLILLIRGAQTPLLQNLSESNLAQSDSLFICETLMVTLSINKPAGQVLSLCQENQQSSGKHQLSATTTVHSCSGAAESLPLNSTVALLC